MARFKTFTNGGSLLPSDLNALEDDYEFVFSTYRQWDRMTYRFDAPAAGTYILVGGNGSGVAASGATAGLGAVYLDPTWATANTRSNYWRIQAMCMVNSTAPAVNFTVGLYPVSAPTGAAATLAVTLGAVQTGSTVAFNTPAAGSETQANSGDFAAPAAGWYALGVLVSGAAAASSSAVLSARVHYREV